MSILGTAEFEVSLEPHSDEFYPEEGVPTGSALAATYFGIKINELPSHIAMDILRALFVDDLAMCFCGRSLDTIECKVVHFTAPQYKATKLHPPHPHTHILEEFTYWAAHGHIK